MKQIIFFILFLFIFSECAFQTSFGYNYSLSNTVTGQNKFRTIMALCRIDDTDNYEFCTRVYKFSDETKVSHTLMYFKNKSASSEMLKKEISTCNEYIESPNKTEKKGKKIDEIKICSLTNDKSKQYMLIYM